MKHVFLVGIMMLCFGCAFNPSTGNNQLMLLSESDELRIGKESHRAIISEYGVYDDIQLSRYVQRIGESVVKSCERQTIMYHFTILDSEMVNAFALPGGYIYVTRGLLSQLNSEAELAFVLGHEVGHVVGKHGLERVSQQMTASIFSKILYAITKDDYQDVSAVSNVALNLVLKGHTREQEHEADELGVRYALKSGYDSARFTDFFHGLLRAKSRQASTLEQFFATHPPPEDRIENVMFHVDVLMRDDGLDTSETIVNQQVYYQQLDRLFMGEGAFLGKISQSGAYINVPYQLRFQLPSQFTVRPGRLNDSELIQFIVKDYAMHGSLYVNRLADDAMSLKTYADQFSPVSEDGSPKLIKRQQLSYLPVPAYQTQYRVFLTEYTHAMEHVISFVYNGFGYRFVFYTQLGEHRAFLDQQQMAFIRSIRFMTNKEQFDQYKGYNLRLYSIKEGDTLAQLSAQFSSNASVYQQQLLGLNGLDHSVELSSGMILKLPVAY